MKKTVSLILASFACVVWLHAQPPVSKEQQELERQRQELKKELEQAQAQLDKNKKVTKENLAYLQSINRKLKIQDNLIDNINREINLMDNTIYRSQRDVTKLRLLLDTLKQEYAKSMVYSYKNRSNYDFLNFIFSASSFNDAIKRVTYLKSYRSYREMQGENILRTQDVLKGRINELSQSKEKKSTVLGIQSKEMDALKDQQEEKNQVVAKLKAQGKELNSQIAAKRKQMQKVNNAIAAAIKRAIDDARKAAAAKAADEKKRRDAEAKSTAAGNSSGSATKPAVKPVKKNEPVKKQENVLLDSDEEVALNASFEKNRGSLPWPVSSGYLLLHYGKNTLGNGVVVDCEGISVGCDIGTQVKAIFDGEVVLVSNLDDVQLVVIKHGNYFTGYSNITGANVSRGQNVKVGQVIGKSAANIDGIGAVDLKLSKENSDLDPERWLRRR